MPDGSAFIVRVPAADSGGEFVEMEFVIPPGGVAPPPHIHPQQVESYEVIEGSFELMVDGRWSSLAEGESASVPRGSEHTFRNRSGETARVLNWHRPAVRFEDFIERVNTSLAAAGVRRKRDPRLAICLSTAILEFDQTLIPSRRHDRIAMEIMSGLGRMFGVPPDRH